jgi:two-component system response regulator CpxR
MNAAPIPEAAIVACENTIDFDCPMPRLLIIDDDRDLAAMLVEYLEPEGFAVDLAHTGREGLAAADASPYALVILDVMLPEVNGLDVLRGLRTKSNVPVIMLTARGREIDRIVGLEIGADDYLAKPFSSRELLARINAVLRRTRSTGTAPDEDRLTVGDLVMEVGARTVRCGGRLVNLTALEFDLLHALVREAGRVVLREALFRNVLKREYSASDRSIDSHVSSLRRKLGARADGQERIRSVRSAGYLYARTAPESGESTA